MSKRLVDIDDDLLDQALIKDVLRCHRPLYDAPPTTRSKPPRLGNGRADSWCYSWYHTSVVKTTVYLPSALKQALTRLAGRQGRSEAELVRLAIERLVNAEERPRPTLPLFSSLDPQLAERAEEHLAGFGE